MPTPLSLSAHRAVTTTHATSSSTGAAAAVSTPLVTVATPVPVVPAVPVSPPPLQAVSPDAAVVRGKDEYKVPSGTAASTMPPATQGLEARITTGIAFVGERLQQADNYARQTADDKIIFITPKRLTERETVVFSAADPSEYCLRKADDALFTAIEDVMGLISTAERAPYLSANALQFKSMIKTISDKADRAAAGIADPRTSYPRVQTRVQKAAEEALEISGSNTIRALASFYARFACSQAILDSLQRVLD